MMMEFEKWLARVLLLNSGLALAVCLGLLGQPLYGTDATLVFAAAMLGFAAAVLSLKRCKTGLWGAVSYYGIQVVSYFPVDHWHFSVKAGVSVGLVMRFPDGVVVINMVALTLLAATAAALAWRMRRPPAISN